MLVIKTTPAGFSLIELLIAIGILAIIAIICVPFFDGAIKNYNLSSATRDLTSDLRYAQQLAVTTQVNYSVSFNVNSNSYQIKNTATSTAIKTVTIKNNIRLQNISGLTSSTVTFNATGAALSIGSITLINPLNHTAIIEIKPSGYVKID